MYWPLSMASHLALLYNCLSQGDCAHSGLGPPTAVSNKGPTDLLSVQSDRDKYFLSYGYLCPDDSSLYQVDLK